jgi:hypothetical protein
MNTTLKLKITVPASAGASIAAIEASRGGSTDPREFLAMRARQKKAQARARRWRLGFLALVGAGMLVTAVGAPRWRHRAITRAEAAPPIMLEAPAAVPALAVAPAPAVEPQAPVSPPVPAVVSTTPAEPAVDARCQDDFAQRHWRAAIGSCAQAFEATPDPGVAMKLAQAYWAHDEVERAGKWASRAVALGSENADAFVLIGHAEREAGESAAAITAYRKYLRQAPYGWHAVRVRAAIRELKAASASAENTSASN